jgi:hypothetical protein
MEVRHIAAGADPDPDLSTAHLSSPAPLQASSIARRGEVGPCTPVTLTPIYSSACPRQCMRVHASARQGGAVRVSARQRRWFMSVCVRVSVGRPVEPYLKWKSLSVGGGPHNVWRRAKPKVRRAPPARHQPR